jgi:hypothetical protein
MYFVSNYTSAQEATMPLLTLQVGLIVSAIVMGMSICLLLSPEAMRNVFRRERR